MQSEQPKQIGQVLTFFKGTIGFTLGLYLFTYGLVIYEAVNAATGNVKFSYLGFSFNPLEWSGFIFSTGVLLEAVFEVPTGVLADMVGRRTVTILNLIFRGLFFVGLFMVWILGDQKNPSAQAILWVATVSIAFFSFHYSLMSGSFVAWAQDSLNECGLGEAITEYLADAQKWFWSLFIVGGCVGLGLQLKDLVGWAYLLGALLCFAGAVVCGRAMKENSGFDFVSLKDLVSGSGMQFFVRARRLLRDGYALLKSESRLWWVFSTVACASSVFYLVDYVWPIYCRFRFPTKMEKFSLPWIVIILVFTGSSLLGNALLVRWTQRDKERARVKFELVKVYSVIVFFLVLPIFLAASLIRQEGNDSFALWFFIAMVGAYRFADGALVPAMESLQNAYIPSGSQHRSTVLSLGAMLKNVLIVFLVFFGVGDNVRGLEAWLIPSVAAGFSLIPLVLSTRPRATSRKAAPST